MNKDNRETNANPRILFLLDQFREAIENCRGKLIKNVIHEEMSYFYAIVRVFSKMIVTSCSIYTLLNNGYPDDAAALCRQLYEGLVIIDTLLNGYDSNDFNMLESFIDAPTIAGIKIQDLAISCALENNPDDQDAVQQKEAIASKIDPFLSKYQKNDINCFRDYWWAGYTSFSNMANNSSYKKYYIYALLSSITHTNAFNTFYNLDDSEPGILIGNSENGKEWPLHYASLFLYCAAGSIGEHFSSICPPDVIEPLKKLSDAISAYMKEKYEITHYPNNTRSV